MAFIPIYILILLVTIVIDYSAAIFIEKTKGPRKKIILIISILSTCLVLFIFKYINFFNNNFIAIANFFHWHYPIGVLNIILPIGLSFHTFQSLSYVIEVYKGQQKAERHFGIYSLYVMFYPQLVAGPIERPQNLLHQFYEKHEFDYQRVTNGLKSMAWGLFKKMLIADRVAVLVNQIYKDPTSYEGIPLITATVFFAIQIYCDFSGYSDIALGAAQVMGFKLMDNFKQPYFSKSISEFWRRWHISLSTWFKDYVYIPLGGNRVSKRRWHFNLFITFLISGLWHGSNWTYIIWGALHGSFIIFSSISEKPRILIREFLGIEKSPLLYKCIRVSITFILVCFAWIFFRSNNLTDAGYILTHLFSGFTRYLDLQYLALQFRGLGIHEEDIVLSLLFILILLIYDYLDRQDVVWSRLQNRPIWIRWSVYYLIMLSILFYSDNNEAKNFIYFQF
jgi:D-alanyl-lipoteichoic acid acyltransferase DltB (MBOAT superfamily)